MTSTATLTARPTESTSTPETGNGGKTCPSCGREHFAWSATCDTCRYRALPADVRRARERQKWQHRQARIKSGGSRVSRAARRAIRASGLCVYCGALADETDHLWPLSRGGPDSPENLVPCCGRCNRSKGQKLLNEWTEWDRVARGLFFSERVQQEISRLISEESATF
ncbi:HNH endonuclease [Frankia tisae]|uniref:HNH endonuclease n=1 Tax=Frankia tisae TaxID=2950104 RepID=UPI0021C06FBC|nr:HNH endonuclease [Frankia tisae]